MRMKMLQKITVLGGETVVNVVEENNGMLLVRKETHYVIYGIEWQGKRNVQHVGTYKYIQRVWNERYGGGSHNCSAVSRQIAADCVPRIKLVNEYIPS